MNPDRILHGDSCRYRRVYRYIENGITIGVVSSDGKITSVKSSTATLENK